MTGIEVCPACGKRRGVHWTRYSYHLEKHTPEDFELYKSMKDFQSRVEDW